VVILGTLVAAQIGDHKQAETFIQEMNRQWPEDTFVQKYWLPVIRADGYSRPAMVKSSFRPGSRRAVRHRLASVTVGGDHLSSLRTGLRPPGRG
jgi:hypothetical protein